MDLSRALAVLTGSAVPHEEPGEWQEAARVASAESDQIRATLQTMGYTEAGARQWTDQLAAILARAALEAVAEAAREYRRMLAEPFGGSAVPELEALERALDAAPCFVGTRPRGVPMDPLAEDLHLRAEISRLASANMTRGRELTELQAELGAARARLAALEAVRRVVEGLFPAFGASWNTPDGNMESVSHDALNRVRVALRGLAALDAAPAAESDPRRTTDCTCSGTEDPPLPAEMDPSCPLHGVAGDVTR